VREGSATAPTGSVLSRTGLIAVFASLLYTFSYYPTPNPFDEFLALPIAHAIADPGLYSPNDLLTTSGARAPFLLYHAAAWLYRAGFDVDLVWYCALVLSLAATFSGIYYLGRAFVGRIPAAAATVLVACSAPQIGTLNWSWMPQRSFVSATLAFPLIFFALGLAVRQRHAAGITLAALAGWIHPGLGLIACLCCLLTVFDAPPETLRVRALRALPALGIMAAGWWYVHSSVPANFAADAMTASAFDAQFRLFAWHAFVGDHWRDGYAFVTAQLALVAFALARLGAAPRRSALLLVVTLYGLAIAWLAFVYIGGSPMITLTFLVRATALAKPICWAIVAGWALSVLQKSHDRELIAARIAIAVLAIAALIPHAPWATPFVVLAGAVLVRLDLRRQHGVAPASSIEHAAERRVVLRLSTALLVAAVLMLTLDFHGWIPARPTRIWRRLHFSRPAGELAGVERWARTESPRGALFLVPPGDARFVAFRLRAERGIYTHEADVNQLAYDLTAYPLARQRLERAGIRIVRRHELDSSGYERLSEAALDSIVTDGATLGVFPRGKAPAGREAVYSDSAWVVVSLARQPGGAREAGLSGPRAAPRASSPMRDARTSRDSLPPT
jgi:hypothetical protein